MSSPVECPLCLEKMDIDDLAFFPCTCKYQICRFCWFRITTEEDGLCPACRNVYTDQPNTDFNSISNDNVDFRTINKSKKRKELTKTKNQIETMKSLPELRVVQPNLIFVIGLPPWMSKERDQLGKELYFGKFGKVFKVEINQNQTFTGPQGSSSISAYVTYHRAEDAMRAIAELDQTYLYGRQLRVSLGTTKYCSQFLKGSKCTKHECMYLHELGDREASFTKEEMQNGKHTDYMNRLLRDYSQNNVSGSKRGFNLPEHCDMMHEHEKMDGDPLINQSNSDIEQQHSPQQTSNGIVVPSNNKMTTSNASKPINDSSINILNSASANNQNSLKNRQKTPSNIRKQTNNNSIENKSKDRYVGGNSKINDSNISLVNNNSNMDSSNNQFMFGHQNFKNEDDNNVDIDFDPFSISQNGLAELMAAEQDRISRINLSSTNNNNSTSLESSQQWPTVSSTNRNLSGGSGTGPGMRNFHQPQPIGISCVQRESGNTNVSSRVIHPPPGFEEKQIDSVTKQQSSKSTSHPPGLTHIPDQDLKNSQNYVLNTISTPSKMSNLMTNSSYDQSMKETCQNTLAKALDFACIAFRIALSLDNQEDDKFGLDLNTFLLHLSDSTGIDYLRLQSAITKSSKVSCILSSLHTNPSTNNSNPATSSSLSSNNNTPVSSMANGVTNVKIDSSNSKFNGIFQQLSRSTNEDLLRHNSLWSGPARDGVLMESSTVSNLHSNSSNPLNSSTNISKGMNATSLLLQQSSQASLVPPPGIGNNSLFASQGSSNMQNLDMVHSKHSHQNSSNNNTWHIDDPAIVSSRFLQDSSETNIRSCLWQPTSTQPSFINPQSSSLVRQMNLSTNNQSSTWSHSHLHQSQTNQIQTSENSDTNVPSDKAQQSIFCSNNKNNIDPNSQKLSAGSRHLQNVIKNFSVS